MTYISDLKPDSTNSEISKWLGKLGHPATEGAINAVRQVLADRVERKEIHSRRFMMLSREERRRMREDFEAEEQARDKRLREELDDFAWVLLAFLQAEINHRLDRRAGLLGTPATHHWHRAMQRYIASKLPDDCILPSDDNFPIRDASKPLASHLLDEHRILINGVTPARAEEIFKQLLHDDSVGFLCRLRSEGMRGAVEILYPEDPNDSSYVQSRKSATPSYSQVLRNAKGDPVQDERATRAFWHKNAQLRLETLMRLEILHPELSRFSPSVPPLGLLPVRHKVSVDVDLDGLPPAEVNAPLAGPAGL
jgi:hypothetical protein